MGQGRLPSDDGAERELDAEWGDGGAELPLPQGVPQDAVRQERPAARSDRGLLTSARSKARRAAVELLFEAEQRGLNAGVLVEQRIAAPTTQTPLRQYTIDIVRGVVASWATIEEIIATYSRGWQISRMPAVDRAILRVATWEIIHNDDVPAAVAVSEAATIAKVLSTDESPAFVNGLLSRIAEVAPTLR
ncbi:transcription antitermination factor NusB [Gephyromycinifex aptenodytis]|uniref:transcription antitermination factor NusB n=1 Tax=Gephyromycinifex aptenodytis TaxID=2716227 RepID=UPI001445D245|nr:transcription antitermination factor NusB [Gephyromycinifex aptenodytis]